MLTFNLNLKQDIIFLELYKFIFNLHSHIDFSQLSRNVNCTRIHYYDNFINEQQQNEPSNTIEHLFNCLVVVLIHFNVITN